jgi:hypothetical protein
VDRIVTDLNDRPALETTALTAAEGRELAAPNRTGAPGLGADAQVMRARQRIADHPRLGLSIVRAVAIRLIAVGTLLATLVAVDVGVAASGDTGAAARPPVSGR